MTLFIVSTILIVIILYAIQGICFNCPEGPLPILILIYIAVFFFFSASRSKNHYLDPEIKPIEIQKAIIKDSGAFLLYKIEGEEEEKAENINYLITDKASHLLVINPKPSVWWFINFASKKTEIYLNKEDMKKWL